MIGADEHCAYDLHWNVIAVRRSPKEIDHYLACANALGLPVQGSRVMLPSREIGTILTNIQVREG